MEKPPPLDLDALGAESRRLACAVFQVFSKLAEYATMHQSDEQDGLTLEIRVPHYSGEKDWALFLTVYTPENGGATLCFGPNHVHAAIEDDDFDDRVDWLAAILDDDMLIAIDDNLPRSWSSDWLDLREADALEDYLTDSMNSGRARLISWSGTADRDVSTDTI